MADTGLQSESFPTWLQRLLTPREAQAEVIPQDEFARALIEAIRTGAVMAPSAPVAPAVRARQQALGMQAPPVEDHPQVTGAFNPVLKQLFAAILQAAQARPETVGVRYGPTPPGSVGEYESADTGSRITGHQITLAPRPVTTAAQAYAQAPPPSAPAQETLTHELLHFLGYRLQPEVLARQQQAFATAHPWMTRLLGMPKLEAPSQGLLGTGAGQHQLIRYLLGGDQAPQTLEGYAARQPLATPPTDNPALLDVYRQTLGQLLASQPALRDQALQGLTPGKGR